MNIEYAAINSPVGRVGLAWTTGTAGLLVLAEMDAAVSRTEWDTTYEGGGTIARLKERLRHRFPDAKLDVGPDNARPLRLLRRYFEGDVTGIDALDVDPGGTTFQAAVWHELRQIRPGDTRTYGELAARAGRPGAARAAGGAVGANPIPIVIPCHRIVGSDGKLTGFGGGISRKRWLLRHEGAEFRDSSRQLRFKSDHAAW